MIQNFLASIMCTITISTALFSSYTTMLLAGISSNPAAIFRMLVHAGGIFSLLEMGIYIPNFMMLIVICLNSWIVDDFRYAVVCTAGVMGIYGIFRGVSVSSYARMFPSPAVVWASVANP